MGLATASKFPGAMFGSATGIFPAAGLASGRPVV